MAKRSPYFVPFVNSSLKAQLSYILAFAPYSYKDQMLMGFCLAAIRSTAGTYV